MTAGIETIVNHGPDPFTETERQRTLSVYSLSMLSIMSVCCLSKE
jgi:hypothetical protein